MNREFILFCNWVANVAGAFDSPAAFVEHCQKVAALNPSIAVFEQRCAELNKELEALGTVRVH